MHTKIFTSVSSLKSDNNRQYRILPCFCLATKAIKCWCPKIASFSVTVSWTSYMTSTGAVCQCHFLSLEIGEQLTRLASSKAWNMCIACADNEAGYPKCNLRSNLHFKLTYMISTRYVYVVVVYLMIDQLISLSEFMNYVLANDLFLRSFL